MNQIYLDNQATTAVDPHVLEDMLPYFSKAYSNASSSHDCGQQISKIISQKRKFIAEYFKASSQEVYFTSGATESINLAIKGFSTLNKNASILTCKTEHSAVLNTCKSLSKQGHNLHYCNVKSDGSLDMNDLSEILSTTKIDLVCLMHVNNEIGVIHDVHKIGELCRKNGAKFFVDATQSLGKISINVESMHIDMLAASGHKIYGPKGIGLLYVRKNLRYSLAPLFNGGGQEGSLRSGTLNIPGVIGFAEAINRCIIYQDVEKERIRSLSVFLFDTIRNEVGGIILNGDSKNRIHGNVNFQISEVPSELLLGKVAPLLCISTSSSCNSTKNKGSHVLRALGLNVEQVASSIRIGIGRFTTKKEIEVAINEIVKAVKEVRSN